MVADVEDDSGNYLQAVLGTIVFEMISNQNQNHIKVYLI